MISSINNVCHSKENILFLHGFLEDSSTWDSLIHFFINEYNVFTYDFPGHGKHKETRLKSVSLENICYDIISKLNVLGINDFHLCCHSMGGYFGLFLKEHYPNLISKIILTNSLFSKDSKNQQDKRFKTMFILKNRFAVFCNLAFLKYTRRFPQAKDKLIEKSERAKTFNALLLIELQKKISQRKDQWDTYKKSQTDFCIIFSQFDEDIPWEKEYSLLKKNAFILTNETHLLPLVSELEWSKVVLNHLK